MSDDELSSEKALKEALKESIKQLGSRSALDLMAEVGDFHKQLMRLVDSLRLPSGLIIGVLTSEVYRLCNESGEFKHLAALELFKRYVDENFIKKEKDI